MIGPSDTNYPVLEPNPARPELETRYTPSETERIFAAQQTAEPALRVGLLVLLKTFQRLRYFVKVANVPSPIVEHIAKAAGYDGLPEGLSTYDFGAARMQHMHLVRAGAGISPFNENANECLVSAALIASRTRTGLAGIINAGLEELERQHYEFPDFLVMLRIARSVMDIVNRVRSDCIPVVPEDWMIRVGDKCPDCEPLHFKWGSNSAEHTLSRSKSSGITMLKLRALLVQYGAGVNGLSDDDVVVQVSRLLASGRLQMCRKVVERVAPPPRKSAGPPRQPPPFPLSESQPRPATSRSEPPPDPATFPSDLAGADQAAALTDAARDGVPFCEECAQGAPSSAGGAA